MGGATESLELAARRCERLGAARADRDGGAGFGETERDRAADATAAAADDDTLAGEIEGHDGPFGRDVENLL